MAESKAEGLAQEGIGPDGSVPASVLLLRRLSARVAAKGLREEHPQAIALALALAGPQTASAVVPWFTERLRNDVLLRMGTLGPVARRWIGVLDAGLSKALSEAAESPEVEFDGVGLVGETLGGMEMGALVPVLLNAAEYDPDLAARFADPVVGSMDASSLAALAAATVGSPLAHTVFSEKLAVRAAEAEFSEISLACPSSGSAERRAL